MKKLASALGVLMLFGLVLGLAAQEAAVVQEEGVEEEVVAAPTADARIKAALDRKNVDYEIDDDGDFRIIFPTDDDGNRTQLVFVNSAVEKYGDKLEIRAYCNLHGLWKK